MGKARERADRELGVRGLGSCGHPPAYHPIRGLGVHLSRALLSLPSTTKLTQAFPSFPGKARPSKDVPEAFRWPWLGGAWQWRYAMPAHWCLLCRTCISLSQQTVDGATTTTTISMGTAKMLGPCQLPNAARGWEARGWPIDPRQPASQGSYNLTSRKLVVNKGPMAAAPYNEAKTLGWPDTHPQAVPGGVEARGLLQNARRPVIRGHRVNRITTAW